MHLAFTYQQVQKNEKGTNRIGASRLQQLSQILQVPVAFFFEGAPNALAPDGSSGSALSMAQIDPKPCAAHGALPGSNTLPDPSRGTVIDPSCTMHCIPLVALPAPAPL